jgi:hypothetical protein
MISLSCNKYDWIFKMPLDTSKLAADFPLNLLVSPS